jgi:hypothetical protein
MIARRNFMEELDDAEQQRVLEDQDLSDEQKISDP